MRRLHLLAALVCACAFLISCQNGKAADDGGGGRPGAAAMMAWPDVTCPDGPMPNDPMARELLQATHDLANGAGGNNRLGVRTKAMKCMNDHAGLNELHCAHVWAAYAVAQRASAEMDADRKDALWDCVYGELDHDSDGSGVAAKVKKAKKTNKKKKE